MKAPDRADALAAANRVRELAADFATDLAQGYRKSSRYLRLRVAVVGTWILLALGTIWGACPPSGPTNALGADVQLLPATLVGAQILVRNGSERLWTEVTFTLNGEWALTRKTVRPGDSLVLSLPQFKKGAAAAPPDLAPATLTIEAEEGRVTAPLAARR